MKRAMPNANNGAPIYHQSPAHKHVELIDSLDARAFIYAIAWRRRVPSAVHLYKGAGTVCTRRHLYAINGRPC